MPMPIFFLLLSTSLFAKDYQLPTSARIVMGRLLEEKPNACPNFHLKENDVRQLFKEARPVTQKQIHDNYTWVECFVRGEIYLGNKTYNWKIRPGNLLETDYPDGKIKNLGGKPSDNPEGSI